MTSFVRKLTFLRDMKHFNLLLVYLFGVLGCYAQQQDRPAVQKSQVGVFYGEAFTVDEVDGKDTIWERYHTMSATDTVALRFKTTVKEVCKVKGCWMFVELPDGEQAMVRFKDYGFFMPSDIPQKEVILNGLAFVEVMSVEDQRHYATDGGKTAAEIANIRSPKRTYSFEASGVLVPN